MATKVLFSLFSFCMVFRLVFTSLSCFGHTCHGDNYCKIRKEGHTFHGQCTDHNHEHWCRDHHYFHNTDVHVCSCETQLCINKVAGHETHLHCIDSQCTNENPVCQLTKHGNQILGQCHLHHTDLCEDHHFLKGSDRNVCRCITQDCITKVISDLSHQTTVSMKIPTDATEIPHTNADSHLQCIDSKCTNENPMCQLSKHGNQMHGQCHQRHMHLCEERHFLIGGHFTECRCGTQDCIRKVLSGFSSSSTVSITPLVTTATHTTTTHAPSTTRLTTPLATTRSTTTLATTRSTTTLATTRSTTTLATTRSTTPLATTRSTTTVTTRPPIPSTTATHRVCHVCGDSVIGIPCTADQIRSDNNKVACTGGNNYCMTDVVQDDRGNVDVFKSCVNQTICLQKWLHESATKDYCTNYALGKQTFPFACHFCCIGDGCNAQIVPEVKLWFV